MRQNIENGKTLLIDGPACVALLSGAMRVFGAQIKVGDHIIVRRGRRIPIEAIEDSQLELLFGNSSSYTVIDEDPIPPTWEEAVNKILSAEGRVEVAVLGGIDSGKSSFCIYLANMALNNGRSVALVDGDLGQSDIGPPGTLGLSFIGKPIIDPFNLQPDHLIFIGITSPYNVIEPAINGLMELRDKAVSAGSNFVIINTDGWIEGFDAVNYKYRLLSSLKPNFAVAIQNSDELSPIIDSMSNMETEILTIEVPKNIKKRDRETRKMIRESSYKRYLREARIRSYPLSWIEVDGNLKIKGKLDQFLKKKIEDIIGDKIIYCENSPDYIMLVLKEEATLNDEGIAKLTTQFSKPLRIMRKGDEKGLLVALEDKDGKFLGIGTINSIDFDRSVLKVYTNVKGSVAKVHVGQIRLNEKGSEVEIVTKEFYKNFLELR